MIESVAQILEAFIEIERERLEELKMPHNPTLGEAYEKLIEIGLQDYGVKCFNLDLRVVSGFIEIEGELVKHQIDCMLVVGEGKRYGLTEKYIYDVSKVLIIFEVKKKLTPKEIDKAVTHLSSLTKRCSDYFVKQTDGNELSPDLSVVKNFYAHITSKVSPDTYKDIYCLEPKDQIVLFSLLQDHALPLRIIHSFEGYKTERGLRKAYLDYVENTYNSKEYWRVSVPNLPNLITSGEFAIVKGTGQPYFIQVDGKLIVSASTKGNIARVMLEVIWIKVSRYFKVQLPWGDDLEQETLSPLVRAIPRQEHSAAGWEYRLYHHDLLCADQSLEWKPYVASKFMQEFFMEFLVNGGAIDCTNKSFVNLCRRNDLSREDGLRQLTESLLFAKKNDYMVSVYNHVVMAETSSDCYITHDYKRFQTWCKKYSIKPFVTNFTHI